MKSRSWHPLLLLLLLPGPAHAACFEAAAARYRLPTSLLSVISCVKLLAVSSRDEMTAV